MPVTNFSLGFYEFYILMLCQRPTLAPFFPASVTLYSRVEAMPLSKSKRHSDQNSMG